ncbi:MAG: ABC transporter ATP-binding protein/permease [Acidimicrobiia bacterium]|nr:ABC transporter ATP-binding protein/permease [Acidimicrobiia bacterium]
MADGGFNKGLRSAEVRTGLRLLGRTLLGYRADSVRSILGALLWMSMVVAVPYLVKVTIDRAIEGDQAGSLGTLVVIVLVAGALQSIGIGLRRYFGFRLSYRAEADLRNRMFEHTQRLAFEFHDQTTTGELMARASSDLSQVRLVFAMLPITVANIAMFISVVVVLIILDPVLGLTAGLTVPALFFTANRYAGKVLRLSFDLQARLAGLSEVVEEAIAGVNVVKSYGQEAQESGKLGRSAQGIFDKSMDMAKIRSRYSPLFEFIPTAGTVAVLWLGGIRVIDGAITLGDFVAFTQYLSVLVLPLRITGWFFANIPRAAASATRIQELLGTDPQIATDPNPQPLPTGNGSVRFQGVTFSYPEGPSVLNGIDLEIPGGTSVGLVGATGSGKTTLAHLIPRFYDVGSGSVTVDGVDIRALDLDVLRNEVAVVFQETFLFSASIGENIAVGNPDATDEQIRLAARLAHAHDFVCGMSDGYDTVVGERGESLSGGQRQRIALARAVVRDPRILILDDATSSVDAVVEAEIQEALRRVMKDRTTIIIAHRTSTLALVDRVVFLENGDVAAIGTHEDLLRDIPRYSEVLAQVELTP